MSTPAPETVELPVAAPPSRVWHICTSEDHPVGECGPGCVSYCGRQYRGRARGSEGVSRIDICIICQGLKEQTA